MDTPPTFRTDQRADYLPRDLRTPLPGDLQISEEVLRQIRVKDPNRMLVDAQAIQAYFTQAWGRLNEITARPEIKALSADIPGPPDLLVTQSTMPAISPMEEEAMNSWLHQNTGGRPLAEIQTDDIQNLAREIHDYISQHRSAGDGTVVREEGYTGPNAMNDFVGDVMENKLIFDSEDQKHRWEELKEMLRSGRIKQPGEMLLAMLELQLDQINRKLTRGLEVKTRKDKEMEKVFPDHQTPDPQHPQSVMDTMKMQADMMKFSGDSNQLNFTIQSLLNNKEKLIAATEGLLRDTVKLGEQVDRAIAKIG